VTVARAKFRVADGFFFAQNVHVYQATIPIKPEHKNRQFEKEKETRRKAKNKKRKN